MTADVITTYRHQCYCADCNWLSEPQSTIEEATRLAVDHNLMRHGADA